MPAPTQPRVLARPLTWPDAATRMNRNSDRRTLVPVNPASDAPAQSLRPIQRHGDVGSQVWSSDGLSTRLRAERRRYQRPARFYRISTVPSACRRPLTLSQHSPAGGRRRRMSKPKGQRSWSASSRRGHRTERLPASPHAMPPQRGPVCEYADKPPMEAMRCHQESITGILCG